MITSQQFIEMLDDVGYAARRYSGRGMYGKQCVAVVTDDNPMIIAANLMYCQDEETQGILLRIITSARSDSMGLSTVHYFPRVEWTEDCEEAEQESDE